MLNEITFMTALAAVALGIIVGYLSARKDNDNTHALSEAMMAGFDAGMVMGQKLMMSQVQQAVGQQQQDTPTDDNNKVGFKFTTPSNTTKEDI